MGGFGTGRKSKGQLRPVVEDYLRLDILNFKKEGLLSPGTEFTMTCKKSGNVITTVSVAVKEESLSLQYYFKEKRHNQEIFFVRTPCHYGGLRTWFQCPLCGFKRNSLYLGTDGYWHCRKCHGLAYKIQRLNPHERHLYRAQTIRKKLLNVKSEGIVDFPEKPFRMGFNKYHRIMDKVMTHQNLSFKLFFEWVDKIKTRIEKSEGTKTTTGNHL